MRGLGDALAGLNREVVWLRFWIRLVVLELVAVGVLIVILAWRG